MQPNELRNIRLDLGASLSAFAGALGYSGPSRSRSRQMRRLEAGSRDISNRVAELARWYRRHGLGAAPPARLAPTQRAKPIGDKSGDNSGDIVT